MFAIIFSAVLELYSFSEVMDIQGGIISSISDPAS
jgi:hypothetical protein